MKLQAAMDVATLDEALVLSRQVAGFVDILELGTPLIEREGVAAVRALKAAYPDKIIFADLKTAGAGELEADRAFTAGADLVTVMGAADDDTIRGAVTSARHHGKGVVADMVSTRDRGARARQVTDLGVEFCQFHAGPDERYRPGHSVQSVIAAGRATGVPFSVAGGVDVRTIRDVLAAGAVVAVVGSAIRSALEPAAAARQLRTAIGRAGAFATRLPWTAGAGPHGIPPRPRSVR